MIFKCNIKGVITRGIKMAKRKKSLSVSQLEVGMISVSEIKANGRILVAAGVAITEIILNRLKETYAGNQIEIYYEEEFDKVLDNLKSVAEIEESFNELSESVEEIFDNMRMLQQSGIDEVRKFSNKIQSELESISSIVKNIVIYGSGADSVYRHSVNVAAISAILGNWIGLDKVQINLLTYAAILHDFGKTKISQELLDKRGQLTRKEMEEIKSHATIAYNYIKDIPFLDKAVYYGVLLHHEKCDGSGYPLGLTGDKIHQFAKIIAIADVFDAVNSDRVYKKSRRPFEALEIIKSESYSRLDFEYCNVFLKHIVNYYTGENVLLNTGEVCKIIQVNTNDFEKPLLLGEEGFIDLKNHKDLHIEKFVI